MTYIICTCFSSRRLLPLSRFRLVIVPTFRSSRSGVELDGSHALNTRYHHLGCGLPFLDYSIDPSPDSSFPFSPIDTLTGLPLYNIVTRTTSTTKLMSIWHFIEKFRNALPVVASPDHFPQYWPDVNHLDLLAPLLVLVLWQRICHNKFFQCALFHGL
jgi:hypothetical protein